MVSYHNSNTESPNLNERRCNGRSLTVTKAPKQTDNPRVAWYGNSLKIIWHPEVQLTTVLHAVRYQRAPCTVSCASNRTAPVTRWCVLYAEQTISFMATKPDLSAICEIVAVPLAVHRYTGVRTSHIWKEMNESTKCCLLLMKPNRRNVEKIRNYRSTKCSKCMSNMFKKIVNSLFVGAEREELMFKKLSVVEK